MFILTPKIDAEAQRLWNRLQYGIISKTDLRRAAALLDRPAIAALGDAPVSSCGIQDIQELIRRWGDEFGLHALALHTANVADLIELNPNCSIELVRAIDMVEIWQRYPNRRNQKNVAWAHKRALNAIRRASRGMDLSGRDDPVAVPYGLAVLILEVGMKCIYLGYDVEAFDWTLQKAVEARTISLQPKTTQAGKKARRRIATDIRNAISDWVLRREYNWRFITGPTP